MTPRLRRIGLWIVAGVAALAGLAAALVTAVHLPPGERWLAGKVEEAFGQGVEVDGLRVTWPFTLTADYLRLKDRDGTWLTATAPELRWHPERLWRRQLSIERLAALRVDIHRQPAAEPSRHQGGGWPGLALDLVTLSLPVRLGPEVVGEAVALDVGGTFQMRQGGGQVDLHARSDAGGLARLAGTAGRDYLDLRWYVRLPSLARWSRLAGQDLAGEVAGNGLVTGRLPSPVVSGSLDLGSGHAGTLGWEGASLSFRLSPERGVWQWGLSGDARSPRLGGRAAPYPLVTLAAMGNLAGDGTVRLGMARLAGDGIRLSASGMVAGWGRHAVLRLDAQVDDLSDYLPATGRMAADATMAGDLLAAKLDGVLRVHGDGVSTGVAALDRLLGPAPKAVGAFHAAPGGITLSNARVVGSHARLALDGRVGAHLDLWATLHVPELAPLGVSGSATAWAMVGGTAAAPRAVGVAGLDRVAVEAAPPASGTASFDLGLAGGAVAAALTVADTPVEASTRLAFGQPLRLHDLEVRSHGARVTGDLAVEDKGLRGRLTGSIPDLGAWQALLGRRLDGAAEAKIVLDPADGQSARLSLTAHTLALPGVAAERADLDADVTQLSRRPQGTARVFLSGVEAGGVALDEVRADAHGVMGPGRSGRLDIDRLQVVRQHRIVELAAATRVDWRRDGFVLAPTRLDVDGGSVTVAGRLDGGRIDGRASVSSLPLDLLTLVAPEAKAVGMVDGTAGIAGTLDHPLVRFALTGRRIGVAAASQAGLGELTASLSGRWEQGELELRGSARDGERMRLSGEGSLRGRAVAGRVQVAGDLARLTEALPLAGHAFAGQAAGAATVSGTLDEPRLDGDLRVSGGRYENLDQGTVVAGLAAQVGLAGRRFTVAASGNDGGRGQIALDGGGSLAGEWRGEVRLNRFTVLRRDDVEAAASGRLDLAGQGAAGRLTGNLAVDHADIDIGRFKGAGPVTIDVVEINKPGPAEDGKTEDAGEGGGVAVPLDLALDVQVAVAHAFVRGRGLDSEWQGPLRVAGTVGEPVVSGRLVAQRGDYQFLGKSFRLSPDSAIRFEGGDSADPALEVSATARASDITARVDVTGTARAPDIAINSDPPLPEDEVLARLLFNKGVGNLSAFQQIQLAQMAATGLTSKGGGFDPIGDVRGMLGLDVLDVGGESASGPTLSAGKYIGRNTFLRVEQGTQGVGSVTVEQELGGGFSLESEVGQQSGGGIGLSWRKNY